MEQKDQPNVDLWIKNLQELVNWAKTDNAEELNKNNK